LRPAARRRKTAEQAQAEICVSVVEGVLAARAYTDVASASAS